MLLYSYLLAELSPQHSLHNFHPLRCHPNAFPNFAKGTNYYFLLWLLFHCFTARHNFLSETKLCITVSQYLLHVMWTREDKPYTTLLLFSVHLGKPFFTVLSTNDYDCLRVNLKGIINTFLSLICFSVSFPLSSSPFASRTWVACGEGMGFNGGGIMDS